MGGDPHGSRQQDDGAPPGALRAGGDGSLTTARALKGLLRGAIDYAGLFPPASLGMAAAVAEYRQHRSSTQRWALGRFVVPIGRWDELELNVYGIPQEELPWPVSVLASPTDAERVEGLPGVPSRLRVESVECKASNANEALATNTFRAAGFDVFVEAATLSEFPVLAPAIARAGAAAKIRTGGTTPDAFPAPRDVLSFLRACAGAGIRFKATAGLHHAVRGEYRLTYEKDPPTGTMFGFLNVAVAACLVWHGRDDATVLRALDERALEAFEFSDDGLSWRGERLTSAELAEVRAGFFAGFGSCSFREPMADVGLEVARPA